MDPCLRERGQERADVCGGGGGGRKQEHAEKKTKQTAIPKISHIILLEAEN